MGCNAWNHPVDCNCGWGGDTGGGGRQVGSFPYRSLKIVDGLDWHRDRVTSYETFVNPNASCPVCGAAVYFYQSADGGRVFFDELGPPWPKHACTDKYLASASSNTERQPVVGPKELPKRTSVPLRTPCEWRPLLVEEFSPGHDFDRVRMHRRHRTPSEFLYLPASWVGDTPAFWRWCPEDPTKMEVSCFRILPSGEVETRIFVVPNWLKDDEEFEAWRFDSEADLTPEVLNAIGFSLSFAWRLPNMEHWYELPGVDLQLARSLFERAADGGYWAAVNNLGVMYRDGLGVARDPLKAFNLFEQAAQSLEVTSLRHLVGCYRDGVGCNQDDSFCEYLEELIVIRSEEDESAA